MTDWRIFRNTRTPHDSIDGLPPPPPWRPFRSGPVESDRAIPADNDLPKSMQHRGRTFHADDVIQNTVNAALILRRPILVTGNPGTGKSSLIDAIAYELRLGEPLRWAVTSRSTLRDALYSYDAVGRLQATQQARSQANEGQPIATVSMTPFLRLGPLGTALTPTNRPWALLVDEIDKADLDLPNDLLNVLEEGEFEIPELARLDENTAHVRLHGNTETTHPVTGGRVRARQFPVVVFTSNGEREFPPAFLRRCLRLEMPDATKDVDRLTSIVRAHLTSYFENKALAAEIETRIRTFVNRAATERLATDQLLGALLLVVGREGIPPEQRDSLARLVTPPLA